MGLGDMLQAQINEEDAKRFRWWFAPYDKSKQDFTLRYIEGCQQGWTLDQWRVAIDFAMAQGATSIQDSKEINR